MEKTEWKNESGGKQALTHKVHKALETIVYTVINNKKKAYKKVICREVKAILPIIVLKR